MGNLELWKKAFDIFLNKGDVYSYDYEAAVKEIEELGITIQSKPSPVPESAEVMTAHDVFMKHFNSFGALSQNNIKAIITIAEEYAAQFQSQSPK